MTRVPLILIALLLGGCTLSKPISLGLEERQLFFKGLEELTPGQFPESLARVARQHPESFWGQRAQVIQALFEKQEAQNKLIRRQQRQLTETAAETKRLRTLVEEQHTRNQQLKQLIIEMEMQQP